MKCTVLLVLTPKAHGDKIHYYLMLERWNNLSERLGYQVFQKVVQLLFTLREEEDFFLVYAVSSCCLISLKRTPRLRAWRAIIMLRLFNCTAMEITGRHQSCCWLNDLCQEFPFHHPAFSLLKYENYKMKRIIKNCFLSFKNTKNLVLFRNWQEKNVKKPEAVVQRCSVKKGVSENFANQRCFPVNVATFSRIPFFIERL